MDKDQINQIAHLLAGDESGWQTRFANLLGISRGYAHNLLSGERTLPGLLLIKLVIVSRERSAFYRDRATEIDDFLAEWENLKMEEVAGMPSMPKEEYDRQADEAVAIVEDMAFGATTGDDE